MLYLTKSDFIACRDCATKLYYRKRSYPSRGDDNEYMQFLADGGYMIETLARLRHAGGREIGSWDDPIGAFDATRGALAIDGAVLFEASVVHGNMLARVDILKRQGQVLKLIEVKSKSFDSTKDGSNPFRGAKGGILSEWRPYLEDATFQVQVLKRAFPEYEVQPFLCIVDKGYPASANTIYDKFRLRGAPGGRGRPVVEYLGEVGKLPNETLLAELDVSAEVNELEAEVVSAAHSLAAFLKGDEVQRPMPDLGKKCKACEYRMPRPGDAKNGFAECWGDLAFVDPHVLDLYRIDLAGGKNDDMVAKMARSGSASMLDVPGAALSGKTAERQRLQIVCTSKQQEFRSPALAKLLKAHPYPHYFIDFEASQIAVPYHAGMRPYERAVFQWSCHTIPQAGAVPEHHEWLNDKDAFPNFEFAATLRDRIGETGTVYTWHHYEATVLKDILKQMDNYGCTDAALQLWLGRFLGSGRVVDLLQVAKEAYFHPIMKGSLSIKHVLPAVWEAAASVRAMPVFAKYVKSDAKGQLLNPYDTLPALPIGGVEEVVSEGTAAMRTYQDMMYGLLRDDQQARSNYRKILLQYCELDTAAMVMIWNHWAK